VTITPELVRRLVATQFPSWAGLPITPVDSQGWDNATYRLGNTMSARLPRFPRWVGQVEREQRWLPRLAPNLPLAIPAPLAMGSPDHGYPFPWSVYQWIDGSPVNPDTLDQHQAALDLAKFLGALQEIDPTGGPPPQWSNGFRGAPIGDPRDSAIVADRVLPKITELSGVIDTDAITAVWEAGHAAPPWAGPPVWIHGDLAPGNLLCSGSRLIAVIDFGTLAIGDPACDLIAAWILLSAPARATFRLALSVDDATWARGRVWGLAAVLPTRAELSDPVRGATAREHLNELVKDLS
jgi:aminoglycoside phosphotransferase (APT) family kinase protein